MSVKRFEVNHTVDQAARMVKNNLGADLIDKTVIDIDGIKKVITLTFEKYFMRVSNRVGLFVIIENTKGVTTVKSIATGASESMFFKFDWGASDSFSSEVENVFNYNV